MKFTRRRLLASVSAAFLLGAQPVQASLFSGSTAAGGGGGGGSNTTGWTAEITYGVTTYVYTQVGATDHGDFIGPNYTRKQFLAPTPSPSIDNLRVTFRPNSTDSYCEVIFHLFDSGNLATNGAPAHTPAKLGAHTVVVKHNGVAQNDYLGRSSVAASSHNYGARWCWRNTAWTILNTPSQIVSNGWFYAFASVVGGTYSSSNFNSYTYTNPMDTAGVLQHMTAAGQWFDRGIITEWAANWMMNPSGSGAASAMLATAEASGSIPWCAVDSATNGPVDLSVYPTLQWNSNFKNGCTVGDGGDWAFEDAHSPALSIIAFMATGQLYFLEGTLFEYIGPQCVTAYNSGAFPVPDKGQDRSYFWCLRNMGFALKALQIAESWGTLPGNLFPSSHINGNWQSNITDFYNTYVTSSVLACSVFGAGTLYLSNETWETDFAPMVYGWALTAGFTHTHLQACFDYKMKSIIDRYSGNTAWPPAYGTPYDPVFLKAQYWTGDNDYDITHAPSNSEFCADWGELWTQFCNLNSIKFQGYIDAVNAKLHVTSITQSPQIVKIGVPNRLEKIATAYDHLIVTAQDSGTDGGIGVYSIDPSREFYTFGITFTNGNPSILTSLTHSFVANDRLALTGAVPTGFSTGTLYYVIATGLDTTHFQLSATMGGSAITPSSDQTDRVYLIPHAGSSGSPVALSASNALITVAGIDAITIDPMNGGFTVQSNAEYLAISRMDLAIAKRLGSSLTGLTAALANADTLVGNYGGVNMDRKYSVAS